MSNNFYDQENHLSKNGYNPDQVIAHGVPIIFPEVKKTGVAFWIALWTWISIGVLIAGGWIFQDALSYAILLVWAIAFFGGFLGFGISAIVAIVELFMKRSIGFCIAALILSILPIAWFLINPVWG